MSKKEKISHRPQAEGSLVPDTLPDGWSSASLGVGLIVDLQPGFASGEHSRDTSGVAHLRPMNVNTDGHIDLKDVKYVSGTLAAGKGKWLQRGDVLFNNTNSPELVGKTAYYDRDESLAFSNHMTRVEVRADALDARYLASFLHANWKSGDFQVRCNQHVSQASIGREALLATRIPIPPLSEQRRIAEKLSAISKRVSGLCDQLHFVPTLLERAKLGFLLAGCTGELTTEWRSARGLTATLPQLLKQVEQSRLTSLARKRRRIHPRFIDPSLPNVEDLPDLPDLPSGWIWTTVGFVASRLQYGSSARSTASASDGIPNIGMQNIQDGSIDLTRLKYVTRDSHEFSELLLQPGDLLFNRTNSPELVGKSAVFVGKMKAIFASYLVRVQVQSELAIPQYVCHWINSPWGRMWAEKVKSDGVSQSNINSSKLAEMPLPLPTIDEQVTICDTLQRLLSLLEKIGERTATALTRAECLMQSCSVEGFSGRFVATEASLAARDGYTFETGRQLLDRIQGQIPPAKRAREVAYHVAVVTVPRANIMKKLQEIGKTHLFDLLVKGKKGMTPQELLLASELDVDDFYTQLKREVEAKKVKESRKGKTGILLEAAR